MCVGGGGVRGGVWEGRLVGQRSILGHLQTRTGEEMGSINFKRFYNCVSLVSLLPSGIHKN